MKITIRHDSSIPMEFPGITPDLLSALGELEIAKLPILFGNRQIQLGEVTEITECDSKDALIFCGDTARIKSLGAGMAGGTIFVEGDVGLHAGTGMTGGTLAIFGNASDWLGAEMHGGLISVVGNAGHNVGSAYRGSRHGMRGGSIIVKGNAGDELGLLMRRGIIMVEGVTGAFAGTSMIAGTIVGTKGFGPRAGAGMKRGSLISCGQTEMIAPGFRYSCDYAPSYLDLFRKQLWPELPERPTVRCYRGDVLTGGRGELLQLS